MKAVRMSEDPKGPAGLRIVEVAAPAPGPDEIRVRVRASALNRADLLQTLGLYPAPKGSPPDIPGLEYAGEVAECGARVSRWAVGDRVMGVVGGGAWAEELTTHEREAIALPAGLPFERAAAIPEAFLTAWDALVLQGRLAAGQVVLVHAAASGVGTAAVQLAHAAGATVIGTGRSPAKLERTRALGVSHALTVDAARPAFAKEVRRLTGGRGADLVLELVGGDWLAETLAATAPQGTVVLVGLLGGATAELSLATLLGRRLTLVGTTLRARPLEEKIALARRFEERVVPLFERGVLSPIVDSVSPMGDVAGALSRLANNDSFGKLVVTW